VSLNRVHVWISGEILYASDLNTEFSNITNVVLPGPGKFSVSGNLYNATGIADSPVNFVVWQAPLPCTAASIKARVVGGTNAVVNVMKNEDTGLKLLATNATVTPGQGWLDLGTLQNTLFLLNDNMEFMLVSVSGAVTQILWQVNFTNP